MPSSGQFGNYTVETDMPSSGQFGNYTAETGMPSNGQFWNYTVNFEFLNLFIYAEEGGAVFLHEGVRLGLVLVVEGVEVEVLLVAQEALADEEGQVVAALQLAQEVVMVELVDLLDVAEDDVALTAQRLRNVLPRQLRNVILSHQIKNRINLTLDRQRDEWMDLPR